MSSIVQSGQVTPGHVGVFATDGVLADGGPPAAAQKVLASVRGASFNTTLDQPLVLSQTIRAFMLTSIIVTNASLSLSAAEGGFYTGAFKTGTQLVASTQLYAALTTPNVLMALPVVSAALLTRFSSANLTSSTNPPFGYIVYFSLTAPQGVACSADIYLLGVDLS